MSVLLIVAGWHVTHDFVFIRATSGCTASSTMASFSPVICRELLCNNTGQDLSGSKPSHCHRPLLWWKTLPTILFAAVLIYVANTPLSISPFHAFSLCFTPSSLSICLSVSFLLSRLFSWSAVLNRSFILQSPLTHFLILFSIPPSSFTYYLCSTVLFILFSLYPLSVSSTPVTFPYSSSGTVVAWQKHWCRLGKYSNSKCIYMYCTKYNFELCCSAAVYFLHHFKDTFCSFYSNTFHFIFWVLCR